MRRALVTVTVLALVPFVFIALAVAKVVEAAVLTVDAAALAIGDGPVNRERGAAARTRDLKPPLRVVAFPPRAARD